MTTVSEPRLPEQGPANVFVGRSHELDELRAGLTDALAGRARLFMLVGEPGIGKTRMADEVTGYARTRGARVLWGRFWEGEGAPAFWPWMQVIRSYAEERSSALLQSDMGPGAADIARVVPEIAERLPGLSMSLALEAAQERFRLFESVTTFLKNAAKATPLVLVFDDLQWADKPSLLLLHFLAREMRDARLLLIGTYRDADIQHHHPHGELIGKVARESRCIVLSGLSEPDVAHLIEATWGLKPRDSLVQTVHERTEGNPLFVTELLRLLASEARQEFPQDVASWSLRIPHGVRHTIRRRLEKLTEAQRRILAVASVIGRDFSLGVLERVRGESGATTRGHLVEALGEARAIGVVSEVPNRPASYRFAHALVRDTLYDDLSTAERLRLHSQVGAALEELSAGTPELYLAELAYHFYKITPTGDVDKAISYALRAAEYSTGRVAYEDAARHYELALSAHELKLSSRSVTAGATERDVLRRHCEIGLALGESQYKAGDMPKSVESFKRVADLARQIGAPDLIGRAALGAAGRSVRSGIDQGALALLEEAAALGDAHTPVHVQVLSRLAMALRLVGAHERSGQLSARAVELARTLDDPRALAYALDARRFVQWGPCEERLATATEIMGLAEAVGDTEMALWNRLSRLIALLELGDMVAVDAEIHAQAQMAADLREPFYVWITAVQRAMRAMLGGHFEKAEALMMEAFTMGRRVQRETATQLFAVQIFVLRGEQGRLEELAAGVSASADRFQTAPVWRAGLAYMYSELGRSEDARRELECVVATGLQTWPRDPDWLAAVVLLAQACAFLGDAARADTLYDLLLPYGGRNVVLGDMAACLGSTSRTLGMLAATMCRWTEAARHFEDALEMNTRIGARPHVARTQHAYAAMLLARSEPGDRERALRLLTAACATFAELGMTSHRDKASALRTNAAGTAAPDHERAPLPRSFRSDGSYWDITYEGTSVRLKQNKGMQYVAYLLRHPGREFHVADLLTCDRRKSGRPAQC